MRLSKHILYGFLALFATASVTSCGLLSGDDSESPEYIAVQVEEDGLWAFWNPEKGIVLPDEFKAEPTAVYNGMFSVQNENGTYALYHFDEKVPKPVKDCEELYSVGSASDGLIPVTFAGSRICVIDKEGNKVFTLDPVKGKEIEAAASSFYGGMLIVRNEDGKLGTVDKKGKVLIEPRYDRMFNFGPGHYIVGEDKESDTKDSWTAWSVIDRKGEQVFKIKKGCTPVYVTNDGVLFVRDENDHIIFFDKKGESTKCPTKVSRIVDVSKDAYVFANEDGEEGVMSMEGEVIIRAKYDSLRFTDEGYVAMQKDKLIFLDKEGEVVSDEDDYNYLLYIKNFGVAGKAKNTYDFYNCKGEAIKDAEFRNFNTSNAPSVWVKSDFLNLQGIAEKVGSLIKMNGFGSYTFGTVAKTIVGGEPEKWSYSAVYSDPEEIKGFRYTMEVKYFFSSYIASSDFDINTYNFVYSWNNEAKLCGGNVDISTEGRLGRPFMEKLIDVLSKKSLKGEGKILESKAEKDEDKVFGYSFTGSGCTVYIVTNNKKENGKSEIVIVDKSANNADYMRSTFNGLFDLRSDSSEEAVAAEVVEEADSVATY